MNAHRLYCFATLLIAFSICGCGKSLLKKVTGTWHLQPGEELFDMMGGNASDDSARFVLDFQRGGVFKSSVTASGHQQSKEGRWFFVEGAGDTCKLRIVINSANSKIEPDNVLTEIKFIDENTIELIPPNMDAVKHKMKFHRAQ